MTEAPLNGNANREKMTQIAFESFCPPLFYIGVKSTMILYASGRTTGMTVNIGYDTIQIAPLYEGYIEPQGVQREDIGGKDLTEYLHKLLNEENQTQSRTPVSMEIANDIKEKLAFVRCKDEIYEIDGKDNKIEYELPDGNKIELDKNMLSQCCEVLFDPALSGYDRYKDKISDEIGLSNKLYESIMKVSVSVRYDLWRNVVIAGGTSYLKGISERIQKDVEQLAPFPITIKIIAPEGRECSEWVGGSILTSLSTFEEMWITKDEYDETGPSIVHRKCV